MVYGKMRIGQVVGATNSRSWVQVASEMVQERTILTLVTLNYDGESDLLDLSEVGGKILEEAKRVGRESNTLTELDRGLAELKLPIADIKAAAGVVVLTENKLLISAGEGIRVYLKRKGKVGLVHRGGVMGIAGEVMGGDVVALVSAGLINQIGLERWQSVMGAGVSYIEELSVWVHEGTKTVGMATIVGEVVVQPGQARMAFLRWIEKLRGEERKPLIVVRAETKRVNSIVGGVLLTLLFLGMVVGFVQRARLQKEEGIKNLTEIVMQNIREAESVADINPERANYLLTQARSKINEYIGVTGDKANVGKAQSLIGDLEGAETKIFKRQVVQTNTLIELSLLDPELKFEASTGDGLGNLLITSSKGQIFGLNLQDKSSWKVSGGPYLDITEYEELLFGLKADGVYRMDKTKGGEEKVIEADELWVGPKYIGVYGGNVYVMDTGQGEIWKYPVLSQAYGERQRWLGAGISLDFSYVTDMFIDGDVWIVTSSGKLEKYSRGVPSEFVMDGFPYFEQGRLASPTAVVTTESELYLLEPGAKRVVVLSRETGKYVKQYHSEDFAAGVGLIVFEGRGYVLTNDKVIWFEL